MDCVVRIGAYGQRLSGIATECDDGALRGRARRLRVRVIGRVELAVLVALQRTRPLLHGAAPCGLDRDKLRRCGDLAVDVGHHLRLVARRVKALVALHVVKQAVLWLLRRGQVTHAPASG